MRRQSEAATALWFELYSTGFATSSSEPNQSGSCLQAGFRLAASCFLHGACCLIAHSFFLDNPVCFLPIWSCGREESCPVAQLLNPRALELPFTPASLGSMSASSITNTNHPSTVGGATLLIVDDDAGTRKSLRRIFEGAGHRTITATNAPSALRLLSESSSPRW